MPGTFTVQAVLTTIIGGTLAYFVHSLYNAVGANFNYWPFGYQPMFPTNIAGVTIVGLSVGFAYITVTILMSIHYHRGVNDTKAKYGIGGGKK